MTRLQTCATQIDPPPDVKPAATARRAGMTLVVLGLSLSSAWGNGHAVTYRALLAAMARRGHRIVFLERRTPWYAAHRDLAEPDYADLRFYDDPADLARHADLVRDADAVIVGSYVPDGVAVGRWALRTAHGVVAFYDIDTPVTLAALERDECPYLAADMIPLYDVYLSFTGGPTLERLERRFGSPAARALACSADTAVYRPSATPPRWDLSYLGTYSADRQPVLEALLVGPARAAPHLRFVVAGPQYPPGIDWPDNVERIDHLAPADHPAFYGSSRYTLNVTRADMVAAGYSPSIRLFEAAACGTPVISDVWAGLEALFRPDQEIVLARTGDDVIVALARPPQDSRLIGAAARSRILAEHTPDHRAIALETALQDARCARRRRLQTREPAMKSVVTPATVLVAGGAGFLGSHLCDRLLADGAHVVCLDNLQTGDLSNLEGAMTRPNFEFVRHDIVDPLPDRITRRNYDRIYDLACAASPPLYQRDPEHTLLTCVVGVRHLLQLAEKTGARFLLSSTSEIYGDPEVHPQPETYRGNVNPIGPRACYDEGKRAAETLTFDFDRAGRGVVRVARIFNTYGPRLSSADGRVVSNVVSQALAGDAITVFGDGSQTRCFCYVDDMIGGLIALMEHQGDQPGPVNIGNPAELSVGELVEVVLDLTGSASPVVRRPLPVDDPRRRRPDIGRAVEVLGWRPRTALEDGLRRTIDWFEQAAVRAVREPAGAVVTA
jgi:nucleoside-diphosphate-sugar epimerase/spore maturation protein CgeB